jgi:hypothetical protein
MVKGLMHSEPELHLGEKHHENAEMSTHPIPKSTARPVDKPKSAKEKISGKQTMPNIEEDAFFGDSSGDSDDDDNQKDSEEGSDKASESGSDDAGMDES